jgi:hypothetical protein
MEDSDREATQLFQLRSILIGHCGEILTPNKVDAIFLEIKDAITQGPCSWAFKGIGQKKTVTLLKPVIGGHLLQHMTVGRAYPLYSGKPHFAGLILDDSGSVVHLTATCIRQHLRVGHSTPQTPPPPTTPG